MPPPRFPSPCLNAHLTRPDGDDDDGHDDDDDDDGHDGHDDDDILVD